MLHLFDVVFFENNNTSFSYCFPALFIHNVSSAQCYWYMVLLSIPLSLTYKENSIGLRIDPSGTAYYFLYNSDSLFRCYEDLLTSPWHEWFEEAIGMYLIIYFPDLRSNTNYCVRSYRTSWQIEIDISAFLGSVSQKLMNS